MQVNAKSKRAGSFPITRKDGEEMTEAVTVQRDSVKEEEGEKMVGEGQKGEYTDRSV